MAKESVFSKLFSKLPNTQQSPESQYASRAALPNLKLVFFIVDWNLANAISGVFLEEKVRFHFIVKAKGTAGSEVLDLLGIGASDKAMVICLEQAVGVPVLLKEVRKKLGRNSPGAGIAFTIPLSAINDPVLLVFKQSIHKNEKIAVDLALNSPGEKYQKQKAFDLTVEGKGGNMGAESSGSIFDHDLIVAIVNHGYSDEFMNTAREAGASGGTVINARGQAHEGAVKFFGISVQEEKELLIILSSREKKVSIMQAVSEAHGLNSKAHGIVFSLPVDNVMGLSFE
jgi:nitrogen regulatory protein PII